MKPFMMSEELSLGPDSIRHLAAFSNITRYLQVVKEDERSSSLDHDMDTRT